MISTSKLTGRTLVAAFRKYCQHRARVKAGRAAGGRPRKDDRGEADPQGPGAQRSTSQKSGIKDFERVLNK